MSTPMISPAKSPSLQYRALAQGRAAHAASLRRSSNRYGDTLAPLRVAMQRRACELELSAAALREIATGQQALDETFDRAS